MSQQEQGIYEFGIFQLDVGKGILLRENQPVSLQWKTFELLCTLVKSNGNLLTRDELMDELWADTFVEENNLSQHISALRKALGENGNGAKFIETVTGRGYRFLSEVRIIEAVGENKLALSDKTRSLIDTETVSQTNALESLAIARPTLVPQISFNENDAAIVPIVVPQTQPKSSLRLKPMAIVIVVTAFIAGVIAWSYNRDNSSNRRLLYANQINLAAQAWETSNLPLMKEQLDSSLPKNGEEDLRGFEWYYLSRLYADNISAQSLTLQHSNMLGGVAFSPNGKTLATACWDNKTRVWDVATGQQIATFKGHTQLVEAVAFSPDGKILVTGSWDTTAKLWDIAAGQELFTLKGHIEGVSVIYFSPDGRMLATANSKTTKFWDVATGKEINNFFKPTRKKFILMAYAPDVKIFATREDDQSVKLWEIATGRNIATFKGHTDVVVDARFSSEMLVLEETNKDRTLKLFNASTRQELAVFKGNSDEVISFTFSPNGKRLVTGSWNDTVRIWDVITGQQLLRLKGGGGLAFAPDSNTIATASRNTAQLWRTSVRKE